MFSHMTQITPLLKQMLPPTVIFEVDVTNRAFIFKESNTLKVIVKRFNLNMF